MTERINLPPTIRIKRNMLVNKFVEGLAQFHRRTEVIGQENIHLIKELLDQSVPVEIWSNHLGHADGPLIPVEFGNVEPSLSQLYVPITGTVLYGNRVTRVLVHAYNGIWFPAKRKNPQKHDAKAWEIIEQKKAEADQAAAEDLLKGRILGLFPEASRSRPREIAKFDPNIARYLYVVPNVHVIPVAFWGTEKVLPPEPKVPVPRPWARPHMSVGRPISIKELEERVGLSLSKEENDQKLVDEVGYTIADLLPEEYRGHYAKRPEKKSHLLLQ